MGEWGKPDKRPGRPKKEGMTNAGEIIDALHKLTGMSKQKMAEELGISRTAYQSYFEHDMRMDTFLKVVGKFGYHIEVRPVDTGLVEFRDNSCENCEFRRFVENTRGDIVVDFYPDKKAVEL